MNIDKAKMREIAKRFGDNVSWVGFDSETGRHTFQKTMYRAFKIIGLDGKVEREGGTLHDNWVRAAEYVYPITECYPEQIDNGDLEWMLKNGYTQTGPRPCDEDFE